MYFESRAKAGALLAAQLLEKYRYEDCAVVALNDGAVLVGEQIAAQLHCVLTMLLVEEIAIPGESLNFGGISESGEFTTNSEFSTGEFEEYSSEFHGYLEEKKREAMQKIHRLVGEGDTINHEVLKGRNIILVSDGFQTNTAIDVAMDFLKPVRIQRLIIVAPVADVAVVDKIHMVADELHILDVKPNYLETNHYYTDNNVPSHEQTIAKINQIVLNWR